MSQTYKCFCKFGTESWKVTLPSSRFPMTACFFRKSLQSFLFNPKATMLWVNVLDKQKQILWVYEHIKQCPKTCSEYCFFFFQYFFHGIPDQCHATHPSWPKVMFSLNLELSSFSSWVIWHHFSLNVQKQGGQWYFSHCYFSHHAWETINTESFKMLKLAQKLLTHHDKYWEVRELKGVKTIIQKNKCVLAIH